MPPRLSSFNLKTLKNRFMNKRQQLIDMVTGAEEDNQFVIICEHENGDRTYYNDEGQAITPSRIDTRPKIIVHGESMVESIVKLRDI